jgi:DNA ligase-associated metallophosphoesterase
MFGFAGEEWRAVPGGGLFWPRGRALVVADLHLEKASWFAAHGQLLPPYDSAATVDRLAAMAGALAPASIHFLGDSFHDSDGIRRLPTDVSDRLRALGARHRLVWIAGNHDGLIDEAFGGTVCEEDRLGAVTLRHAADSYDEGFEISGHYHPKVRVKTAAKTVSRPCFALSDRRLIMPAFGALTGGLDVRDPVFAPLMGSRFRALVPTRARTLSFDVEGAVSPALA